MKGPVFAVLAATVGGVIGLLMGTVAAQSIGIILTLAAIAALVYHICTT